MGTACAAAFALVMYQSTAVLQDDPFPQIYRLCRRDCLFCIASIGLSALVNQDFGSPRSSQVRSLGKCARRVI